MTYISKPSADGKALPTSIAPVLANSGQMLIDNGYEAVPLHPGDKRPIGDDWQNRPISAERIAETSATHGPIDIGCRTGKLVGVDVDVWEFHPKFREILAAITAVLGSTSLVRWGRKGCLLLYRTDAPMAKRGLELGGDKLAVEVLGVGQQVVLYGVHPDTKMEYSWDGAEDAESWTNGGPDPMSVKLADLPAVTSEKIAEALAAVAKIMGVEVAPDKPHDFAQPTGKRVTREGLRKRLSYIHPSFNGERPECYPAQNPNKPALNYGSDAWVGIGLCLRDGVPTVGEAMTEDEGWDLLQEWSDGRLWLERTSEHLEGLNVPPQGVRARLKGEASKDGRAVTIATIIKYAADGGCPLPPDDEPASEIFKDVDTGEPTKPKTTAPFLHSITDILTWPDPEWLVANFIIARQNICVYGAPKGGKTLLSLDVGLCIAAGLDVFGKFPVKVPGPVVYLSGESHSTVKRRLLAWAQKHGMSHEQFAALPFYYKADVPCTAKGADECKRFIDGIRGQLGGEPVLVGIDTMSRALRGLKENSADDLNQYIGMTEALRDGLKCTVLTVAHSGKDESRGMRGSNAGTAGFDGTFLVWKDEAKGRHGIEGDDLRDMGEFGPLYFRWEPVRVEGMADDVNTGGVLTPVDATEAADLAKDDRYRKRAAVGQALRSVGAVGVLQGKETHILARRMCRDEPPETDLAAHMQWRADLDDIDRMLRNGTRPGKNGRTLFDGYFHKVILPGGSKQTILWAVPETPPLEGV